MNNSDEQKFIDALQKFGFVKHLRGSKSKKFKHTNDGGSLHNSHLHSSFDEDSVIIVKEK